MIFPKVVGSTHPPSAVDKRQKPTYPEKMRSKGFFRRLAAPAAAAARVVRILSNLCLIFLKLLEFFRILKFLKI